MILQSTLLCKPSRLPLKRNFLEGRGAAERWRRCQNAASAVRRSTDPWTFSADVYRALAQQFMIPERKNAVRVLQLVQRILDLDCSGKNLAQCRQSIPFVTALKRMLVSEDVRPHAASVTQSNADMHRLYWLGTVVLARLTDAEETRESVPPTVVGSRHDILTGPGSLQSEGIVGVTRRMLDATSLLTSSDTPTILSQGCAFLSSAAQIDDRRRDMIMQSNIVVPVIKAGRSLFPRSADLAAKFCRFVYAMVDGYAVGQIELAKAGVLDALISALRSHVSSTEVQVFGCMAIAAVVTGNGAQKSAFAAAAGFGIINIALTTHAADAAVQSAGLQALATLIKFHPENQASVLRSEEILEVVYATLREHPILNQPQKCADGEEEKGTDKCSEAIASSSESNFPDFNVPLYCVQILHYLLQGQPDSRNRLLEMGFLKQMHDLSTQLDSTAVTQGCCPVLLVELLTRVVCALEQAELPDLEKGRWWWARHKPWQFGGKIFENPQGWWPQKDGAPRVKIFDFKENRQRWVQWKKQDQNPKRVPLPPKESRDETWEFGSPEFIQAGRQWRQRWQTVLGREVDMTVTWRDNSVALLEEKRIADEKEAEEAAARAAANSVEAQNAKLAEPVDKWPKETCVVDAARSSIYVVVVC